MNLILLETHEVVTSGDIVVSGPRATHIRTVLRCEAGDQIRVGVIDGRRGTALVQSIDATSVTLRYVLDTGTPERPRVDLLLALPRPKVMKRLWPQIAALGVGRIMLTNAERVERDYFDAHILTPEVYRPLLVEGLQQARDTMLPAVSIHKRFKVLVEDELDALCDPGGLRIVADPSSTKPIRDAVAAAGGSTHRRVLVAIGPEGGWNAFELALLDTHGFHAAGMGDRTLRTDTACIAILALVHDAIAK